MAVVIDDLLPSATRKMHAGAALFETGRRPLASYAVYCYERHEPFRPVTTLLRLCRVMLPVVLSDRRLFHSFSRRGSPLSPAYSVIIRA